jgi:hypothetical protein
LDYKAPLVYKEFKVPKVKLGLKESKVLKEKLGYRESKVRLVYKVLPEKVPQD